MKVYIVFDGYSNGYHEQDILEFVTNNENMAINFCKEQNDKLSYVSDKYFYYLTEELVEE
ncbi:hypothetical protein NVP1262O_37 [Vibrio phage 1.262.O._10N.286.51.A9]|nr:hypothetical protein NVP1262O_37 [Vibrio phage 1.262.O._10N.286.51.A9]